MRVAIMGGGASGLAAAWLLDPAHEVHLYEQARMLGGHIRTAGGNTPCPGLPAGVRLDAGVIEFDRVDFPAFHAWMAALGVTVRDLPLSGSTNLFLADGRHFHSPGALTEEHAGLFERLEGAAQLVPLMLRFRRFQRQTATVDARSRGEVDRFLSDDDFSVWVRCLLMYAYSLHYDEVHQLSAALAVPMLRAFLEPNAWTHIPGGVSTYVDAVVRTLRGEVHVDARILGIRRDEHGVTLRHEGGAEARFDHVVLAVPPHRVLPLLSDADATERAWFGAHTGHVVETVLHTDDGPYRRRGVHAPTEFDLFELQSGGYGYNAYLNRIADMPDPGPVAYGLAFDMGSEIHPATVLHRQTHDVGLYSDPALAYREAVIAGNGRRRTSFVGAWLGDGLHEGAVQSAISVADRLGGRSLPGITPGTRRR